MLSIIFSKDLFAYSSALETSSAVFSWASKQRISMEAVVTFVGFDLSVSLGYLFVK